MNRYESTLSDEQRVNWGKFLLEVVQELVCKIVYEFRRIRISKLRTKFKDRFQRDPMDLFHWRDYYNCYEHWYDFVRGIPSLYIDRNRATVRRLQSSLTNSNKEYNTKKPIRGGTGVFASELISVCRLVTKENEMDVNRTDEYGNTALHLVASLPGNSSNLMQHLLNCGADPLKENNAGLNIAHIVAGRRQLCYGSWKWGTESVIRRIAATSWEADDRAAALRMLPQRSILARSLDKDGNTVVHECVFSTQTIDLDHEATGLVQDRSQIEGEIRVASQLLEFGASLLIRNRFGLVPLHFAFNSTVFEFLVNNGAHCRETSLRGETPFLFIVKYFVGLSLVNAHSEQANETEEIRNLLDKEIRRYAQLFVNQLPIKKATFVLSQLTKLTKIPNVRRTIWISDSDQITPLFLLLLVARIACYCPNPERRRLGRIYSVRGRGWDEVWKHLEDLQEFEDALVQCILAIVETGSITDLTQLNKTDQGFLHVLLDIGASNTTKIISRMTLIEKCLDILIRYGADLNTQDTEGRTALHLICKHYHRCPQVYRKCAELLAKNEARIDIPDKWGMTVQKLVRENVQLQAVISRIKITRKVYSSSRRHSYKIDQLTKSSSGVTVVDKCRFTSSMPIGSGAFSNIFVAIKEESENREAGTIQCREVALKRLEKAKIDQREVEREVKTLLSISTQCENIVDYYETTEDENFYYIMLELMEGDLQQFVDDEEMKEMMSQPSIARQAALGVVNGLAFLHKRNFLHRDLKPGNILYKVNPHLCLKIADFGLAKDISSLKSMTSTRAGEGRATGTRCWMAPELVRLASSEHALESDIFALGLVLHYLLTMGKHPFAPNSPIQQPEYVIEVNIANVKISLDSSLADEAKHLIEVILVKNPTRRPPAGYLQQHPFFWSERKKIDFLKAVGDQKEAVLPSEYPNSRLQQCLQTTKLGQQLSSHNWAARISDLYSHITVSWPRKKYRTNYLMDLVRFVRNAYGHKEEQPEVFKRQINDNVLLKEFPSLVLDVYLALNKEGILEDSERTNIQDVLKTD